MIFGRLQWVSHNGFPIYSIDVHPEGKRFATGGGDHKVKIWNFDLVLNDGPEGAVKLFAAMEGHGGPVNCVRFSPDGRFLATASDDHVVLVWELRGGPATPVFGSEETNVENWGRSVTLSGHTTQVNDISWSPDGRRLVTCSLSSEVFVWDIFANGGRGALAAKLVGHTGFVKGVAWDPLNRFIATEADDKTVIIWRVSDWDKEATLARPYRQSSSNCFFRRIGWSPDGSFLATVYGFNNTSHVAPILLRGTWGSSYCDFVGHKKPVVCAKFNPVLFVDADSKKGKRSTLSYCAVGSQDCGLSVWSTETTRPKLVTKNIFSQSVLDIAWAPDGYTLLCCSTDGTAVSLHFDPKELGEAMSAQERSEMLKKLGAPPVDVLSALAEHPLQLQLEKEASALRKQREQLPAPSPVVAPPLQSATPKRIAPTLVSAAATSSSTAAASAAVATTTTAATASAPGTPVAQQMETRLPTGKRRITPQFLGSTYASPRPVTPFTRRHRNEKQGTKKGAANDKDKGKDKAGKSSKQQQQRDQATKADKQQQQQQQHSKPRAGPSGRPTPATPASAGRASLDGRLPRTKSLLGGPLGAIIPVPILVPKISRHLHPPTYDSSSLAFLEVAITTARENVYTSCVALKEGGRTVWEDYIAGRVTAIAGNANFSAIGCEDDRVRVLLEGSACVATMSNQHAFVLHSQMGAWMRVADNSFSRSAFHSQFHLPASQKAETLAHLEHQIAAALLLQSRHEYRYWVHTYAGYLATEALLTRLEELCASLLGPPSRSSTEVGPCSPSGEAIWEPTVLGLNKRQLLREVLPIVAQNRACQRLTVQYQEYLRIISQREATTTTTTGSASAASPAAAATTSSSSTTMMDVDLPPLTPPRPTAAAAATTSSSADEGEADASAP
ncbi:WD domain, G-beta repeat-containing protein [Acanthamoeba castellanii str. Neff]|uniref:Protein HIRA n=1 Tax=Acanthamoeba castellanii (strain ATCC 30010 / Neff) TaxID=1257118 RepID=L8HDE6_ACACF|nr:WD domain, G-beta repeat-containing protein [Acanthamoeba castellanii str. Neff]ELR22783.1 WD domain, G-beta repeat-containing protein [Acanthamoeba castellanii str. Neff]